jgi:3',5'-nucleoside bisphosphate phosphatase
MTAPDKVDLHLHSTESDGRLPPAELMELAHRNGVRRLVLTDHDTTDGMPAALAAAERLGLEVYGGIELSAELPGAELHVLGHFLDYDDSAFQERLRIFRAGRLGRAEGMVARLAQLGAPISWERVRELAGEGSIGRPHIAQALLEAGHIQSIPEAFDRFIANDGPAYVERAKLSPAESIALIHSVHGMAVAAHPLDIEQLDEVLPRLERDGLDGLECYYPGYDPTRIEQLVSLARRYSLVPTGGSDYHGFPMAGMSEVGNEPGTVDVPPEVFDELLRRRAERFG